MKQKTINKMVRTFKLIRNSDVSGISGTGLVAEGIVFSDGKIAMSWTSTYSSIEIHPNIETLMAIHGHNGKTILEFDNK